MTGQFADAPRSVYLDGLPAPVVDLHPVVPTARARVLEAVATLLAVDDAVLEREWPWEGESDVRYGFYRALESLDLARVAAGRARDEAGTWIPAGARRIAPATEARWDLHGRLVSLSDADLDRDPGGGEWTIRQTLGHIINAQRAYGHYTAWWLLQRDRDPIPESIPDEVDVGFPDESTEGDGTLTEVRARLDDLMDEETHRLAALDDGQLSVPARWSGARVDVGFRIGRWSSHLREHTIQVDKTLAMLGWTPREVDRLVGLIVGAWGRLEAQVFGLPAAALDHSGADDRTPASIIDEVSARVAVLAPSVRESASR